MRKTFQRFSIAAAAFVCALGASVPAHAVFVARICNDVECVGGDDVIVHGRLGPATRSDAGSDQLRPTPAFGYSILVNTSQSKPIIGSATAPELDVSFVVTRGPAGGGNRLPVRLGHGFRSRAARTQRSPSAAPTRAAAAASGVVPGAGRATTEFEFSGANLLDPRSAPSRPPRLAASASGPFTAAVSPYSLTIGLTVSRTTAGTSTGDLNLQVPAIPEPSTWALMLVGPLLIGFIARRRPG